MGERKTRVKRKQRSASKIFELFTAPQIFSNSHRCGGAIAQVPIPPLLEFAGAFGVEGSGVTEGRETSG